MGIKQSDIASFLEPESTGFIHDTARSFLNRHSNPESLLAQLKSLLAYKQLDCCRDMIQLILREGHSLSDNSEIYLLRAHVAYLQGEPLVEVVSWIQQAKLCRPVSKDIMFWDQWVQALTLISDGDYPNGQKLMTDLADHGDLGHLARYELAHHLFWKNIDVDHAIALLDELTQEYPAFIKAWSCLGFAFNRVGLKDKAQEAFGHCIELDSDPERLKLYRQQLAS